MSTKLILAVFVAIIAIAAAGDAFSYGYTHGPYGFGGLPYAGYLGFGRSSYLGYPGFNKFAYGYGYPGVANSPFTYSPHFTGNAVTGYGYSGVGKHFGYGFPHVGYGFPYGGYGLPHYGAPVVGAGAAASTSAVAY
uniref:Sulfur globule protein CV3 n=1 Tax=Strongyloides papillosus TaxID=174720 RepID=A0A0N5BT38_STREA